MPTISTNIFDKLTPGEKGEISKSDILGEINFNEYHIKSAVPDENVKYIFDGFDLKKSTNEIQIWDSLKEKILEIYKITSSKYESPIELQFWIKDLSRPAVINILFSIKDKDEIIDLMTTLRTKLEGEIFSNEFDAGSEKILLIGFDRELKSWFTKVFEKQIDKPTASIGEI
ncbi:MAG: hypothetical protein Q7S23_05475 [bacterium]|nr:hypothetical protein [bacterium]